MNDKEMFEELESYLKEQGVSIDNCVALIERVASIIDMPQSVRGLVERLNYLIKNN